MRTVFFGIFFALVSISYGASILNRIKNIGNGGCNFTSANGNVGINAVGNSGQVLFYRLDKKGRIARTIAVLPQSLREYRLNRATNRQASGFSDAGTTTTWNCSAATETVDDGNGGTKDVRVLQSQWSAERTVSTGKVRLEFNVKLYTASYNVIVCPRKYNRTRIVPRDKPLNGTNCTIVTTLPGLKWEFVIDNWPYADPTNYLVFRMRIWGKTRVRKALRQTFKETTQGRRAFGKRRRAARKIISFGGDGYLDNPEEADVACNGQAPTTKTVGIKARPAGNNMFIEYTLPATGSNCVLSYDPVLNDGQNTTNAAGDTTGAVGRVSALLAFVIAGVLSLLFV